MRRTLILRILLATLLLTLGTHFAAFLQGELVSPRRVTPSPRLAVVFTGAHERIDAGLDMLARGDVEQLFISGANPNAGIWLDRFVAQFGRGRADLTRLIACCVVFGTIADTTLENAAETACWLKSRKIDGAIALVTSWEHMPRAHAALAATIGATRIAPAPVGEPARADERETRQIMLEYGKHWGTVLIGWMAQARLVAPYGPFGSGCP